MSIKGEKRIIEITVSEVGPFTQIDIINFERYWKDSICLPKRKKWQRGLRELLKQYGEHEKK